MQRTDIHRPAEIEPANYDFVGFEYLKQEPGDDGSYLAAERAAIRRHMERTGGTYSKHQHGGNCHICGAHAIYTALFYHKPTNDYIRTGLDCAEKLDGAVDGEAFRKKVHVGLEAIAGKRKAKAVLEAAGLEGQWNVYVALTELFKDGKALGQLWLDLGAERHNGRNPLWEEYTITDIVGKLVKYGNISDAQKGFLRTLAEKIEARPAVRADREAQKARKAAEHAAADVVPEGRNTVRGVVLSVKFDQGPFEQTKVLVQDYRGFKVYGTLPRALLITPNQSPLKGWKVEFDAKLERSKDDDKFGFFQRPTKAQFLEAPQS